MQIPTDGPFDDLSLVAVHGPMYWVGCWTITPRVLWDDEPFVPFLQRGAVIDPRVRLRRGLR